MGNPMNGDIYEGQLRPGDVGLSEETAKHLKAMIPERRIDDLRRMFREQGAIAETAGGTTREMPRYKCHKEVWALKIKDVQQAPANQEALHVGGDWIITPEDEGFASFPVGHEWYTKHKPEVGGYYVVYKDGYRSYSPAKAFEDGYTRI